MKKITFKEVILSILYFFLSIILYSLLYYFSIWFINNVLYNIFDWFNHRGFIIKIVLLIFGFTIFLMLIINLSKIIISVFSYFINSIFPKNLFTKSISRILALLNIISSIFYAYQTILNWTFWTFIEFLIIISFIISINRILIPRNFDEIEY